MSDPLTKAEAAVREAETDTVAVQLALAAVELAKAATAQQPPACQHQAPPQFDARKWWTIGGLVCVGGCVACVLALAFAVAMTAIAIGATCATGCFLILRSLWRDYQKGR